MPETPFGDPGPQPQAPALFHAPGSMPSDEELSAFMATVPVLPIPDYLRPGRQEEKTTNARCQARVCELECLLCAFRP